MSNAVANGSYFSTIRPASQVDEKQSGVKLCKQYLAAPLVIASLGLLIAGACGAAGLIPGPGLAWAAVGVGGAVIVGHVAMGSYKERKFEILLGALMAASLVTIGILGGVGILSSVQVGWAIVCINIVGVPFGCVIVSCQFKNQVKAKNEATKKEQESDLNFEGILTGAPALAKIWP